MNMDNSAASSIAEEPLSLSILSSIAEEPLALSLSTDDKNSKVGLQEFQNLRMEYLNLFLVVHLGKGNGYHMKMAV